MVSQKKTPGVYIVEQGAFPNSVVEVATAVPAFLGYTEKAAREGKSLKNVPTRITSLAEYELMFGGAAFVNFELTKDQGKLTPSIAAQTHYQLYTGLKMFFDNGGGVCWIVSVGVYTGDPKSEGDFDQAWGPLTKEQEPTIIVVPDAVLLPQDDHTSIANKALDDCVAMKSRVAILDVFDGDRARTLDDADVISGTKGFRNVIQNDNLSYGMAYYPWLETTAFSAAVVNYTNLTGVAAKTLQDAMADEFANMDQVPPKALDALSKIANLPMSEVEQIATHQTLLAVSPLYNQVMTDVLRLLNVMPPSAAMAGIYARTDNNWGVFMAPANTSVVGAVAPTVDIAHEDQEDLNVPIDGKAVNAIRTFMGRGILVWGARTLDGNSQDWRYINVRRTMIMLEQSIFFAAQAYVFAPNDAATWVTVRAMIENFLNNQWKAGALVGATPEEAYAVSVGLGSTMTGEDILDGFMRITVKVAVSRPAEFIVISFQQKMQTS